MYKVITYGCQTLTKKLVHKVEVYQRKIERKILDIKQIEKIQNKTIVMMRGKSPPSEHVLQKIKSNNSLGFKDVFEWDISFCQNNILSYLFTFFLISRTKNLENKVFLSIRLK